MTLDTMTTYTARLRALAEFLDQHADTIDPGSVNMDEDGPTVHLTRDHRAGEEWRPTLAAFVETYGPAGIRQTHSNWLVLSIVGTELGEISLYVPRYDEPLNELPRVDLSAYLDD